MARIQVGKLATPPLESFAISRLNPKTLDDIKADWLKVTGGTTTEGSKINFEQFKQLMSSMPNQALATLWSMYDLNKDNSLSWPEYICVVVRLMSGSTYEKLSLVFNCMDTDGSGYLSKSEFKEATQKFATTIVDVDAFVNKSFKACDTDHNKKVSLAEFREWALSDKDTFTKLVGTFNPLG